MKKRKFYINFKATCEIEAENETEAREFFWHLAEEDYVPASITYEIISIDDEDDLS